MRIVLECGLLECAKDPTPQFERDSLQTRREGAPFVTSEVGVRRSRGDDQTVVAQFGARYEPNRAGSDVDPRHLSHHDPRIPLAP